MVLQRIQAFIVWKTVIGNKIVSEIPENVTSLAVSGDTIYIGTEYNEMLHYTIEK